MLRVEISNNILEVCMEMKQINCSDAINGFVLKVTNCERQLGLLNVDL